MKNSILKRKITRLSAGALVLLGVMTSCQDDLLTGTPSWLGESIYDELETRGNFTETLKLINAQDEDYASVLKKTGSKTVFVADDDAWQAFYANNTWGVTSMDDMTDAQKKLLFKANMINSAYLVELLGNIPSASSTSDPIEGKCMRRSNSVDIMDSVPVLYAEDFPVINTARVSTTTGEQTDYWASVRGKESIILLQDDEVASMIHLMPKFMTSNSITDDDITFLTNGEITSNADASINGKIITEKDITCQNGYIHVLNGVATPLSNMAQEIGKNPQFSIYSRLLDRFSYPQYDADMTAEYQRQYGGNDSVFVKRYFNSSTNHSLTKLDDRDGGESVSYQLAYDPGWNRYILYSASGTTYQYDAGVILCPTDDALIAYLQNDGADLNERYADAGDGETAWDNAPDAVVLPLLKNTMLSSFKAAIPSQFASINNTASEQMGVEKADIDSVIWACNGIIYQTNKVYVAPEYVSVFYPCVVRDADDLHTSYISITNDDGYSGGNGFYAYLNNMGSEYSFIIPTDNAWLNYYDPVSRWATSSAGKSTAVAYQFEINSSGNLSSTAYDCDWEDLDEYGRGKVSETANTSYGTVACSSASGRTFYQFTDIINSSLATSIFTPGQKFYSNKDGGPIVVEWNGTEVTGVAGSFQYERGYYIPITSFYDKSQEGNGYSFVVDQEPVMSTFTSPMKALASDEDYSRFYEMISDMSIVVEDAYASHATADSCITILNNYNYTIYVPTNESIEELQAEGRADGLILPTWDFYQEAYDVINSITADGCDDELEYLTEQLEVIDSIIGSFVKYHIQDNSLYVDGEHISNTKYETAFRDGETNRFARVTVNYDGDKMTVTDNAGNSRTVDSEKNNKLTRQYYFNGSTLSASTYIYTSSYAVIHQIDKPLFYDSKMLYDLASYEKCKEVMASLLAAQAEYEASTNTTTTEASKRKK